MSTIFALFTALYTGFLLWLSRGTRKIIREDNQKPISPYHQFISIIVPARNEIRNLPNLLNSLSKMDYPIENYEVIIVNDHSDDGSREYLDSQTLCRNLRVIHFYHQTPPLIGKKAALQQGIDAASSDILAFTDADCILPPTWLSGINRSMDEGTDYLLSYSILKRKPQSSVYRLKNFERSVYYALASAGLYYRIPFTSSACNMVYRKSLFVLSGGFEGIAHLASGDDDLLLMKMMPYIRKAAYNPNPAMQVVSIDGTDRLKHHHTNVRRASKFLVHPWWLKALSAFIFVYFCLFYYSLLKTLLGRANKTTLICLMLKTITEFFFSFSHLKQIHRSKLSALYPVQILVFPAQFIFYALRGTLGKYRWK